jgi:hypothetical protein
MANSQLVTTETALETLKKTRNQAETRYFSIQQEKLSLERRNGEIIQVF